MHNEEMKSKELKENKSRTTEQMKVEQQMSGIEHEPIK
jgi:hypothetical protein